MPDIDITHPHFDTLGRLQHTPKNVATYRSRATGMCVNVRRGIHSGFIATPAMFDGSPLPVHAEPLAWADTTFDLLDAIHAQR